MSNRKIAILGLGYVGFPTAVIFASRGYNVIGADVNLKKVESINAGRCYLKEPGLDVLLRATVSKGLLRATTDCVEAVRVSDAVIIAVPTPVVDNVVDLRYLGNALEFVKQGLHKDLLVVIESTMPPRTTVNFVKPLLESSGMLVEEDFYLAHVPERIAPGRAVEELLNVPRVVGGVGFKSTQRAMELYGRVNSNLLPTDATTAEFVKLIENTFRDLNIAYANLLALMAERLGIDIYEAIRLANTHPRVSILRPGAGVGGPCLTKDPYMLMGASRDIFGVELIALARRINDYMPRHMVELVLRALDHEGILVKDARVTVLGVAYKGDVDDVRGTPAKVIIEDLLRKGIRTVVYDPYTDVTFGAKGAGSIEEAVCDSDVLVIVTDHSMFKQLDLRRLGDLMRTRVIIDGRRVVDPCEAFKHGFRYYGIGFGKAFRL